MTRILVVLGVVFALGSYAGYVATTPTAADRAVVALGNVEHARLGEPEDAYPEPHTALLVAGLGVGALFLGGAAVAARRRSTTP